MIPAPTTYRFDSEKAARRTVASLRDASRTSRPLRLARRMTYVDTFDWRLYRKGSRLSMAVEDGTLTLLWRPPGDRSFCRLPVERQPEFVWDLPEGTVREQIESSVEMRRLLPVAELSLKGTAWNVIDRRQKTLLTLVLECGTAVNPVDPEGRFRLPAALRVFPVKGYDDVYRRTLAAIEREGPRADASCPLELALEAFDRDPSHEIARPDHDLKPDLRGDIAMKSVHRRQLLAIQRNVEGLRGNVDTEFLHDFRVAVRRTRSALAQVPEVFPKAVTERYRRGFSWLGKATGLLRDLDVYLLSLPRYSADLSEDLRPALAPIDRFLRRQHRLEHRRLVGFLGTSRYHQLIEGWQEFLDRDVPARTSLKNATRPIGELAGERIRRCHRRVIKKGKTIKSGSPPERLHRLRIECKKLRYLLEFFAPLYAERDVKRLVAGLKKLQNNLGDYNDYVLQQESLRAIVERMSQAGPVPDATRDAVSEVLRQLEKRQRDTRKAFRSRFKEFSDRKISAVFDRLLGEEPG